MFSVIAVDYYNIHEWSVSNGMLKFGVGAGSSKTIEAGVSAYPVIVNNNNRRYAYTEKGKVPYRNNDDVEQTYDRFAIPIPDDASTMIVTITPSTQYISGSIVNDRGDGVTVRWRAAISNTQGTVQVSLPEVTNRLFLADLRYNSSSSEYQTEPTNLVVTFE